MATARPWQRPPQVAQDRAADGWPGAIVPGLVGLDALRHNVGSGVHLGYPERNGSGFSVTPRATLPPPFLEPSTQLPATPRMPSAMHVLEPVAQLPASARGLEANMQQPPFSQQMAHNPLGISGARRTHSSSPQVSAQQPVTMLRSPPAFPSSASPRGPPAMTSLLTSAARHSSAARGSQNAGLSSIDQAVSQMEAELSNDLLRSQANARDDASDNDDGTVDWLDNHIKLIEQRREACELRQARLAELRRLAEGESHHGIEGNPSLMFPDTSSVERSLMPRDIGRTDMVGMATPVPADDPHQDYARGIGRALADAQQRHATAEQELEASADECRKLLGDRASLEAECQHCMLELRGAEAQLKNTEGQSRRTEETILSHEGRTQAAEEAIRRFEKQARLAEDAALISEHRARAMEEERGRLMQANTVQLGTASSRERELQIEAASAVRAQAAAQKELGLLEENSRVVLGDCRTLQARVRELELQRSTLESEQISLEDHRQSLNSRVLLLEEQRQELETGRRALVDGNHALKRLHETELLGRDEGASQEVAMLHRREIQLREEFVNSQKMAGVEVAAAIHATEAQSAQRAADQIDLHELRSELERSRIHAETLEAENGLLRQDRSRLHMSEGHLEDEKRTSAVLESKIQQLSQDHVKIAELESELAEAGDVLDSQKRQQQQHRAEIIELESLLSEAQAEAEGHARQHCALRGKTTVLEETVAEALSTKEVDARQHLAIRSRAAELETLLSGESAEVEKHSREFQALSAQLAECQERLVEARAVREQNIAWQDTLQGRCLELERTLEEARDEKEGHDRERVALQAQLMKLQENLKDTSGKLAHHLDHNGQLTATIEDLEEKSARAIASKDVHAQQCAAQQEHLHELGGRFNEVQAVAHDEASQLTASKAHATLLERHLMESHAAGEQQRLRSNTESGVAQSQITALQDELAEARAARVAAERILTEGEASISAARESETLGRTETNRLRRAIADLEVEVQRERESLTYARTELGQQGLAEASYERQLMGESRTVAAMRAEMAMVTQKGDATKVELHQEREALAQAHAGLQSSRHKAESLKAELQQGHGMLQTVQQAASGMDAQLAKERQALATVRTQLEETKQREAMLKLHAEDSARQALAAAASPQRNSDRDETLALAAGGDAGSLESGHLASPSTSAGTGTDSSPSRFSGLWNSGAGFSAERDLDEQSSSVWRTAVTKKAHLKTLGQPVSVQTQVVSGTNYIFKFSDGMKIAVYEEPWTNTFEVIEPQRADLATQQIDNGVSLLMRRNMYQGAVEPLGASSPLARPKVGRVSFQFDGGDSVQDSSSAEKKVREIPEAYAKVIDQIASIGWERMQWARGFTLLHWAAKNNIPELCARFLYQGADPHQADVTGRSAVDYAREQDPPSLEALAQLERGKPAELPPLPPFATSQQPRKSKAVVAVPLQAPQRPQEFE